MPWDKPLPKLTRPTKATHERLTKLKEAQEFARKVLDDPRYQASLFRRAIDGELPGQLEALLWHYAYGKPGDHVQLEVASQHDPEQLRGMSDEQLAQRAELLARALRENRAMALLPPSNEPEKIM